MRPKTLGMSKMKQAEAKVGDLADYFRTCGKSQGAMATELGVSRQTVIKWMQQLGIVIEVKVRYVRRKQAA